MSDLHSAASASGAAAAAAGTPASGGGGGACAPGDGGGLPVVCLPGLGGRALRLAVAALYERGVELGPDNLEPLAAAASFLGAGALLDACAAVRRATCVCVSGREGER